MSDGWSKWFNHVYINLQIYQSRNDSEIIEGAINYKGNKVDSKSHVEKLSKDLQSPKSRYINWLRLRKRKGLVVKFTLGYVCQKSFCLARDIFMAEQG